jgi:hypothetical protein
MDQRHLPTHPRLLVGMEVLAAGPLTLPMRQHQAEPRLRGKATLADLLLVQLENALVEVVAVQVLLVQMPMLILAEMAGPEPRLLLLGHRQPMLAAVAAILIVEVAALPQLVVLVAAA